MSIMTTPLASTPASSAVVPFPKIVGVDNQNNIGNDKSYDQKNAYAGLVIDLDVITKNFQTLQRALTTQRGTSLCSAVVKADAYGLGVSFCGKALYDAGCRCFFVAYLDEAIALKKALLDHQVSMNTVQIYVLNGFIKGSEAEFLRHQFIPVLTDIEKVERFSTLCATAEKKFSAVLHIDTGINRTGIRFDRLNHPLLEKSLGNMTIDMIMSHLACGDEDTNPFNTIQRQRFDQAVQQINLPYTPKLSLANSAGIVLGSDYHYDIARPGGALYGIVGEKELSLKSPVSLWARIYQIQTVPAHEGIGYGQTYTTQSDRTIATLTLGYADGFTRGIGIIDASKTIEEGRPYVMLGGIKAPLVGRVSMDLLTIDVTDIPCEYVYEGAIVELLNQDITPADFGAWAKTRPYEILLNLGSHRIPRTYIPSQQG